MAIDEVSQSPMEKRYGLSEQSAYGTAVVEAGAFVELDCSDTTIDLNTTLIEQAGSHGTRNKKESDTIVHTKNAAPTVSLEMLAKENEIDRQLYSAIQNVADVPGTVEKKTFTFLDTQPDFQADAGFFETIIERDPASSKSIMIQDAICRSLTITLEQGEYLKTVAEYQGRGTPNLTYNPSGTWTRTANELFHATDLARKTVDFGAGAVAFHLVQFELIITHELMLIGQDSAGNHQVVAMHNRNCAFKLKVIKDADFSTALVNLTTNVPIDINLGWGNASAGTVDGDLDFQMHGILASVPIVHDEMMSVELTGTLCESDDGTTEQLTVIIANSLARAW